MRIRTIVMLALFVAAGLAGAKNFDDWMMVSKKTTSASTYWHSPFENYYAAAYLGTTNADGTLKDYSVNGRDATNNNNVSIVPVSTDTLGRVTYVSKFGGSQYWKIPGTNWLDRSFSPTITAVTFVCWIMVTQHVDYAGIISMRFNGTGLYVVGLNDYTTATNGLQGACWITVNPWYSYVNTDYCPTSNTWHYFAIQITQSNYPTLFLDGNNIHYGSRLAGSFTQNRYVYLGYDEGVSSRTWKGYEGLPRIFTNAVFTPADFTNDMNHSHPLTNTLYR